MTDGNAFSNPCIESINNHGVVEIITSDGGLTKREYFAAMAMQGILSNDGIVGFHTSQFQEEIFAKISVAMSDALIVELNKQTT
jgi:hypothetical protein